MGIRGLQTYMERERNGRICKRVDVKDAILSYKQRNSCSEAFILVDASSTLPAMYGNSEVDWLCGGQYRNHEIDVLKFVQSLRKSGAEPIFFFDGPCTDEKRNQWVTRRFEVCDKVQKLMLRINAGGAVDREPESFIPYLGILQRYILSNVCKCKVVITSIECDEEIAKYAQTHENVAGIWAQDSDFVIFNAAEFYFSAIHYCPKTISTVLYSSIELAKLHGLNASDLPIVASMLTNDFNQLDDVIDYHRRITGNQGNRFPKLNEVFPAVAKFVSDKISSNMDIDEIHNVLCLEMLGSKQNERLRDSIRHSLKTYFVLNVIEPKAPESYSERLLELLKNFFCFFSQTELVLAHDCIDHGAELEDLKSDFDPVIFVFDPINSRYIGVLRNHLRQDPIIKSKHIREYAVYSDLSVKKRKFFKVTYSPFDFDLLCLLSRDNDVSKSLKRKILLWSLTGINVSDSILTHFEDVFLRIPQKLYLSSLVLYYLYQIERIISPLEVNVFISMFIELDSESCELCSAINPYPNYKAIHLATLFNCGVKTIARIASILDIIPAIAYCQSHYFDGILFQKIYADRLNLNMDKEIISAKELRARIWKLLNFSISPS